MKLLLLAVIVCAFFASCSDSCSGKQVTCPAFDDKLALQWVPYSQNQQFIFSSAAGTDTFGIINAYTSVSYQDTVTARSPFCSAEASFTTGYGSFDNAKKNVFDISLRVNQDEFSNATNRETSIHIKENFFAGNGFSDTGLIKSSSYNFISYFHQFAAVGNKTFSNVQEIYSDTVQQVLNPGEIYKFWMARNIGIVAYEEYHGNLWVKQ